MHTARVFLSLYTEQSRTKRDVGRYIMRTVTAVHRTNWDPRGNFSIRSDIFYKLSGSIFVKSEKYYQIYL